MGLSTAEIDWQIRMAEKYGDNTKPPEKEIKAREAARKLEDRTHRDAVSEHLRPPYPEE